MESHVMCAKWNPIVSFIIVLLTMCNPTHQPTHTLTHTYTHTRNRQQSLIILSLSLSIYIHWHMFFLPLSPYPSLQISNLSPFSILHKNTHNNYMAFRSGLISHNQTCNLRYHKLHKGGEGERTRRPCWLRRRRGKAVILYRLEQSKRRRLRITQFIFTVPRKVIAFYTEIMRRLMSLDPACYPTIAFSSQWGMPVLSHPSTSCRRRVLISSYLDQTAF